MTETINEDFARSLLEFMQVLDAITGVYLDAQMGFSLNVKMLNQSQAMFSQQSGVSIEELDKLEFQFGEGHPSTGTRLHITTQRGLKERNAPGAQNQQFMGAMLTREVFKFFVERRDTQRSFSSEEVTISEPRLRRIYLGDDLNGDLALLSEADLISFNERDARRAVDYWRIHFPGSGFNSLFIEYVTDLRLDLRKPLITLDFSDF